MTTDVDDDTMASGQVGYCSEEFHDLDICQDPREYRCTAAGLEAVSRGSGQTIRDGQQEVAAKPSKQMNIKRTLAHLKLEVPHDFNI
ncbi:unnamed protein product [Acanthoscelides obtectus]|uniref:Uncharacterized protein n=1 Tax=Acanthoscelides obtectus TaxID=200917 RepID=A0A9P0NUI9_ACAOB|nr:unnamed protein product [Acanthoscelides obtectus]CAK1661995.1 hypothetical protein AOBTE_LOCUS22921 [Acanthoscelides obtectus]